MKRRIVALAVVAAISFGVTSCSHGEFFGLTSETCVSWVDFDSAEAAFDDASVVVIGYATPTAITSEVLGIDARVYEVQIGEVLKGDVAPGEIISVVSTPVTCTGGDPYSFGDPLDTSAEIVLLLNQPAGAEHLQPLTPLWGVIPLADDPGLIERLKAHATTE